MGHAGLSFPKNALAERMVRTQLDTRDIYNAGVKEVMSLLPRHRFISEGRVSDAYEDSPAPIGHGQTISQPYMVALMTQELRLGGSERTLEIGTGSGYQTAVLASLCAEVYSVERIEALLGRSQLLLGELGFTNVAYRLGDGSEGWPEHAPYDRVLVAAAARGVPKELTAQLADNGILVAPIGEADGFQRLVTVRRRGAGLETALGLACRFVPLVVGKA